MQFKLVQMLIVLVQRQHCEAHNDCLDRVEQLIESRQAGLIDMEEFRAQAERAGARQRAVIALTNAFVPLERLRMTGEINASARANDA